MAGPTKQAITQLGNGDPVNPANANQPHLDLETNIDNILAYLETNVGEFEHDPATTSGTTFGYKGGSVRYNNTTKIISSGTRALNSSTTSYIEVNPVTGNISHNTTGFSIGSIPLWEVTTDTTTITSIIDKRTILSHTNSFNNVFTSWLHLGTAELDDGNKCITGDMIFSGLNLKSGINKLNEVVNGDGGSHIQMLESGGISLSSTNLANGSTYTANDAVNTLTVDNTSVRINDNVIWDAGNFDPNDYLALTGGTLTGDLVVGDTSATASKNVKILSGDGYNAGLEVYGNTQGTGYVYVGESASNGGGMFYNGDGTPSFATGENTDRLSFFRKEAGTNYEVFSVPVSSDTVDFKNIPTVNGVPLISSTDKIGHTDIIGITAGDTYSHAFAGFSTTSENVLEKVVSWDNILRSGTVRIRTHVWHWDWTFNFVVKVDGTTVINEWDTAYGSREDFYYTTDVSISVGSKIEVFMSTTNSGHRQYGRIDIRANEPAFVEFNGRPAQSI